MSDSAKLTGQLGPAKLPPALIVGAAGLVLVTVMALVVSNGNPVVALAPLIVVGAVWWMWVKPLSHSLIALFALSLLMHNPGGRPHDGKWDGPLYPLGMLLYPNLRLILNVDALRFNAIEVLLTFLLVVVLMRWLVGNHIDNPERIPFPRPLKQALIVSGVTLTVWVVWGVGRGGDFKQMLWQTRQLMWAPIMSAMFIHAFRTTKWHKALGLIVLGVAVLRSLDGIYFFYAMVKPTGIFVEYSITHDDSMILITAVVMMVAIFMERPTKRTLMFLMCVAPVIAVGLVVNHRRLAYVSLAASLLAIVLVMNRDLRRRIMRWVIIGAPVLILYIGAGVAAKGESIVFFPIRSLVSVADQKNASNQTRDIENYNLLYTFRGQPLLGSGFGHPYTEVSVAYDISKFMPNYKYIAHNSVLWLLMLCGGVGFAGLWLYFLVTIFFGARVYQRTTDPDIAIAAITSIAAVICYIFQAYGDMGMISWMGTFLLSAANAVVATSAMRIGAWSNDGQPPAPSARDDEAPEDEEPLRAVRVG